MKLSRTSIKNRIFCCFALLQKGVSSIEYHPKRVGGDPGEYQFSSVAQLYPTLCDTMDCSMPGLPAAAAAKLLQSCPTLCDPIDCSLPGSSIHGIFQARILEWGAMPSPQASLSISNSQSLLKLMSLELVMPSSHLILCCPLLLLPSIFPSIRVFSSESALHIRWPKY